MSGSNLSTLDADTITRIRRRLTPEQRAAIEVLRAQMKMLVIPFWNWWLRADGGGMGYLGLPPAEDAFRAAQQLLLWGLPAEAEADALDAADSLHDAAATIDPTTPFEPPEPITVRVVSAGPLAAAPASPPTVPATMIDKRKLADEWRRQHPGLGYVKCHQTWNAEHPNIRISREFFQFAKRG